MEICLQPLLKVKILNTKIDHSMKNFAQQLEEYFSGRRTTFDLPIDMKGTEFQKKVWNATSQIPFGETRTYAQIAKEIGHPKAVRAVGTALSKNPFAIIIPCHRVVPKQMGLPTEARQKRAKVGGYAWGVPMKKKLLEHEKKGWK